MSFGRGHAELDAYLQASGAEWTVLQPNGFSSDLLAMAGSIRQGGIYTNAGDDKVAMIDPGDIAAVAAATLTGKAPRPFETFVAENLAAFA